MKLYLSSYALPTPDDLAKLVGKPLDQIRGAIITNAKDYYAPLARAFKVQKKIAEFTESGLNLQEMDLREFNSAEQIEKYLSDFDLVWADGGNTFCLRYEMQRSGFDQIIGQLLEQGLVWAGDSAGAVIVGPTLQGVETADEPAYAEAAVWDGLGLIDQYVMPHSDNRDFAPMLPAIREQNSGNPNYVEIKDCEAIIIDGERSHIVSREYSPEEAATKVTI